MKKVMLRALMLLAPVSSVLAGGTMQWVHKGEAGLDGGLMKSLVTSNLGELKLSRAITDLAKEDPRLSIVYALQQGADGSVYVGVGPHAMVLRIKDKQITEVFKSDEDVLVTSLCLEADGKLLAGLSGDKAKVLRIDPASGKTQEVFANDGVQLIWNIVRLADGAIVLGTGPDGKIFEIDAAGKSRMLFAGKEHNVLSILPGEGDEIYFGTDPNGLVIRLNRKTLDWFVLYNAAEPEIVALARDKKGRLFAASSVMAEEGEEEQPGEKPGQPEGMTTGLPMTREPVPAPKPPELPNPAPGEPQPIPKENDAVKHMDILSTVETPQAAMPHPGGGPTSRPSHPSRPQGVPNMPPNMGKGPPAAPGTGSAVYCIDPNGVVHEVFRKPVTIHAMACQEQGLVIGTGPDGMIYQVNPDTEEVLALARLESREISALLPTADGKLLLGLSNPGGLSLMGDGYAPEGSYTSVALDATQVAKFGKMQLDGTLADGTTLMVQTRSGNTSDPEKGGWSKWSDAVPAVQLLPITSPAARFFQYRLTMSTRDTKATPTITQVKANYLIPNLAPKVSAIHVEAETEGAEGNPPKAQSGPFTSYLIGWEAADPNNDHMTFQVSYRLGTRGAWVLLKDKLKEPMYVWNTRQMADGKYQVRVVASDAGANPPGEGLSGQRISETISIDNTGPVIGDVVTRKEGGKVTVSARVVDRMSTVASVDYAVDAADDWQAVASSDMLFDSPEETVKFTVSGLTVGQHQLTLRARDSHGNATYETLVITVDQQVEKK